MLVSLPWPAGLARSRAPQPGVCGAGRKLSEADSQAGRPGHTGRGSAGRREWTRATPCWFPLASEALHEHGDRDRTTPPLVTARASARPPASAQALPSGRSDSGQCRSLSAEGRCPRQDHPRGMAPGHRCAFHGGEGGHRWPRHQKATRGIGPSPRKSNPGALAAGRWIRPETWRTAARTSPWTRTSHARTHSTGGGGALPFGGPV